MLHITVITPEKKLYEEEADELTVPTVLGEITILPQHVPLITQIAEGELTIKHKGKSHHMAIAGGFLELSKDKISILADYAIRSEDIDVTQVEEAKKRAAKLMEEKGTDEEMANARSVFVRAILELKIANKRKHNRIIS